MRLSCNLASMQRPSSRGWIRLARQRLGGVEAVLLGHKEQAWWQTARSPGSRPEAFLTTVPPPDASGL